MTSKIKNTIDTSSSVSQKVGGLDVPPSIWEETDVERFHHLLDIQRQWIIAHPPQEWTEAHVNALTEWFQKIQTSPSPPNHRISHNSLEPTLKREWVLQWVDAALDVRRPPSLDVKTDWRAQDAVWTKLVGLWEGAFEDVVDTQSKLSWLKSVVIRGAEHHLKFSCHEMRRIGNKEWKDAMQSYAGKNPQFVSSLATQRGRIEGLLLPDASGTLETPSNVALTSAWCDGVFEGVKETKYADAKFAFLNQMALLPGFSHWVRENPSVVEEGQIASATHWVAFWLNDTPGKKSPSRSQVQVEEVADVHVVVETLQAMLDILGSPKHPDDPWGVQKDVAKKVWGSVQAGMDHATLQKAKLERALLIDRVKPVNEGALRPAL